MEEELFGNAAREEVVAKDELSEMGGEEDVRRDGTGEGVEAKAEAGE